MPTNTQLTASSEGDNYAWTCLGRDNQERAMTLMLGKVFWCIFEMNSSNNSALFFSSEIFKEVNPKHPFTEFNQTPIEIQQLIRECTIDAPEWADSRPCLVRSGTMVHPWGRKEATSEETQEAVRQWWEFQIRVTEENFKDCIARGINSEMLQIAQQRPKSDKVLRVLEEFKASQSRVKQ